MSKIKICGLMREIDAHYVNEAIPEYAGFVFWDKSRRNVSFEQAGRMRQILLPQIQTVGVFVDPEIEKVARLVEENIISCVQLHGRETEDYISTLRAQLPKDTVIIKAFEVKKREDVLQANRSGADMVLIDSGKGSGTVFDWDILSEMERDYFLAGGLSPENVSQALVKLNPYALDVSSKVETEGYKDRDKIIDFCNRVRQEKGGN